MNSPRWNLEKAVREASTPKGLNMNSPRWNLGEAVRETPTPKGLNMNSPRWNLGEAVREAPTPKGLNMNSPRWNLGEAVREASTPKGLNMNSLKKTWGRIVVGWATLLPTFVVFLWARKNPLPAPYMYGFILNLMALKFSLRLFTFNPFGVGALSPGSTWGYSYSTPSGLALYHNKTHRFHLWLFTFNPFRVGALPQQNPQVSPVAIHIQPLQGWRFTTTKPTGSTWGYSHSTPSGLRPN